MKFHKLKVLTGMHGSPPGPYAVGDSVHLDDFLIEGVTSYTITRSVDDVHRVTLELIVSEVELLPQE